MNASETTITRRIVRPTTRNHNTDVEKVNIIRMPSRHNVLRVKTQTTQINTNTPILQQNQFKTDIQSRRQRQFHKQIDHNPKKIVLTEKPSVYFAKQGKLNPPVYVNFS